MDKPASPPPPPAQCPAEHCKDVRCRKPAKHGGLHEYERPTGLLFYWS